VTRLQLLAFVVGFLALVLTLGFAVTGADARIAGPAAIVVLAVVVIVIEARRVTGRRPRGRR